MLGKLNIAQINNILTGQVVGRLACTDSERPYIVPMTFYYDGKYIYGETNDGTKLEILRKNPNLCFEVDVIMDTRNWESVLIYGEFEELRKQEAKKARNELFEHVFPLLTGSAIHSFGHEVKEKVSNGTRAKNVMYRIKIREITGRFEKQ